eukprot:TRINITY_DN179784_c0_g1_i1.p1 TRINITY_DN179784_c0_g1~~TRINITY_DN179784_c0_g1_i1.p1  ORF type:complete len:218 (+),score=-12.99 TRINITY_DN179784_c0_g1_i1:160-813(+)
MNNLQLNCTLNKSYNLTSDPGFGIKFFEIIIHQDKKQAYMSILAFQMPDKVVMDKADDFHGLFEFKPLSQVMELQQVILQGESYYHLQRGMLLLELNSLMYCMNFLPSRVLWRMQLRLFQILKQLGLKKYQKVQILKLILVLAERKFLLLAILLNLPQTSKSQTRNWQYVISILQLPFRLNQLWRKGEDMFRLKKINLASRYLVISRLMRFLLQQKM